MMKFLSQKLDKKQWHLDFLDGFFDNKYTYLYTGENVNVYILDSGVEPNHPSFYPGQAEIIWGEQEDCTGHGSHVSGIVASVAKRAKIKVLKVMGCEKNVSEEVFKEALDFLEKNIQKPAVISISMGLPPLASKSIRDSMVLPDALNVFTTKLKIPVILSAANFNSSECRSLTANTINAVVVGSIDEDLQISDFSNYGDCVNFFAPGKSILVLNN